MEILVLDRVTASDESFSQLPSTTPCSRKAKYHKFSQLGHEFIPVHSVAIVPFAGLIAHTLPLHDMTDVSHKPYKMAPTLTEIRQKVRVVKMVVDRLEPGET